MDLALFDLDETLICADSTGLWLRWLEAEGFAGKELLQREQHLMQSYYQGTLAIEDYMYLSLSPLIGLEAETVSTWIERFIQRDILPRLYPQAREHMDWHRQRGDTLVVISASGEHLVQPIARHLGADHALAIGVTLKDGRFTGDIHGVPTYQHGKVTCIREWLAHRDGEPFGRLYGYSDSLNDRAMLEFVDQAYVVNPSPELAALAQEKDWRICRWQC
ncbi:HAD family hydrolase [Dickeya chrysanthemi]|uniref:HAD family hydrolase n=1 Tax=Dickeya chrysanthemi TaxID=556 RepID=A0ABU8JJ21_DICCH|nr:HAD family hydrolase [Dickeya chrysanthemi]MBX9444524.1 HAD-IB family hydrolase [Dickeya chrysanthemi]MCA7007951.1 HAD-IB family hydrolase [Dickeya chrysanthemi]